MAGGGNRLGLMCTRSGGSPSHCSQIQGLVCGERGRDGNLTTCTLLNNGSSLPRQPTLPPGVFLGAELLTLVPSRCLQTAELLTLIPSGHLHTANSSPLPRSALLTPCFSTQPLPALMDTCLRQGCTGLWHRPSVQVSLYPACHRLATALSSARPQSPPSISMYFATLEGVSPGVVTSPLPQLPSRDVGPIPFPLFFFFPFSPLSYLATRDSFLVLLGFRGLLLVFSRCSV